MRIDQIHQFLLMKGECTQVASIDMHNPICDRIEVIALHSNSYDKFLVISFQFEAALITSMMVATVTAQRKGKTITNCTN